MVMYAADAQPLEMYLNALSVKQYEGILAILEHTVKNDFTLGDTLFVGEIELCVIGHPVQGNITRVSNRK